MAEIILLSTTLAIVTISSLYQAYRSRKLQFSIKQQNAIIYDLEIRTNTNNTEIRQEIRRHFENKHANGNITETEESVYGPLPEDDRNARSVQDSTRISRARGGSNISEKPYSEIHMSDSLISKKSKDSSASDLNNGKVYTHSRDPSPRRRSNSNSNSRPSQTTLDLKFVGNGSTDARVDTEVDMVIDSKRSHSTSPQGSKVRRHSGSNFVPQLETIDSKRGLLYSPRSSIQGASRSGSRIVRKHNNSPR